MPSNRSVKDPKPTPQPDEAAAPATADTPAGPAAYEYTHYADCVYPHVPLTARAATPDTPATVYAWPAGPPDDGRWAPTSKNPNQHADNAPAPSSEE
ncbi:hypothetical protein [Streptomyces sp. YIM S03343]